MSQVASPKLRLTMMAPAWFGLKPSPWALFGKRNFARARERYTNSTEFLGKAYAYQLFFNYVRENRWRDNKSPLQFLR